MNDYNDLLDPIEIHELDHNDILLNENLISHINAINSSPKRKLNTNGISQKKSFVIKEDYAKEIRQGKYRSYTLKLKSINKQQNPNQLLNIVFSERQDGSFYKLGIAYNLTEEQAEFFRKTNRLKGEIHISFFKVDENQNRRILNTRSKKTLGNVCGDGKDEGEMDCGSLDEMIIIADGEEEEDIIDFLMDDDDFNDPPPPRNGEGGGGGGNNGKTTPVGDDMDHDEPENLCEKISALFDDHDLKNKIKELKDATSETYETGYSMDKDGKFTKLERDGNHSLKFDPKQGDIGFLHTHPTTPMFSPADFFKFRDMVNMAARTSDYEVEDVHGVVMQGSNNYYMLKYDGDYREVKYQGGDNNVNLDDEYIDLSKTYRGDMETTFIKFVEKEILDNQTFKEAGFHLYKLELNKDGTLKKSTEKYLDGNRKIMKKTFSFIVVMIMAFGCKAQQTIPLDKEWEYVKSLPEGEFTPEGTYFKDINGVLDHYLGTWSGTFDHYKYELTIYREKYNFYGIYEDVLFVDYKMEGDKIIKGVIKGKGYKEGINSPYILFYTGLDDNDVFCGDKGTIHLDVAQDGKTIELFIIPSEVLISEEKCPNGRINPPFPGETQEPMVLKKVK